MLSILSNSYMLSIYSWIDLNFPQSGYWRMLAIFIAVVLATSYTWKFDHSSLRRSNKDSSVHHNTIQGYWSFCCWNSGKRLIIISKNCCSCSEMRAGSFFISIIISSTAWRLSSVPILVLNQNAWAYVLKSHCSRVSFLPVMRRLSDDKWLLIYENVILMISRIFIFDFTFSCNFARISFLKRCTVLQAIKMSVQPIWYSFSIRVTIGSTTFSYFPESSASILEPITGKETWIMGRWSLSPFTMDPFTILSWRFIHARGHMPPIIHNCTIVWYTNIIN